jgi:rhodanese-related sulfurtransferase
MNTIFNIVQSRKQLWPSLLFAAAIVFAFVNARTSGFDVNQVTVQEAKSLMDTGAVVIDVRGAEAYHTSHIPGAISLPLALLHSGIPQSIMQAKMKPVVVYCGDGVKSGPEGTHLLNKAGFANAVNIKSGIEGWEKAGLPVQK